MRIFRIPPSARALILDIDGTLYENRAWMEEQNDILIRRYALERGKSPEEARSIVKGAKILASGGSGESSLANALAYLGIPIETSVAWRLELLEPEAWLKPDPALRESLLALSSSYRLLALTNNPTEIGLRSLKALGLDDILTERVGLERSMSSKPSPEPFRLALESLGMGPEQIISIGDRYDVDLATPLQMGMGAILVDGPADFPALTGILLAGRGPTEDKAEPSAKAPAQASIKPLADTSVDEKAAVDAAGDAADHACPRGKRGLARRDAFRLLSLLPSILVIALLVLGMITWSDSGYELSLLDRATDRMDPRTVLDAFHKAYPGKIGRPAQNPANGDWILSVDGQDFSWARGRLLPTAEAEDWDIYRPYISFVYPWTIPNPASYSEELVERLRAIPLTQAEAPGTHGAFAAALYGGMDEDSVWERQVRTKFLGWKVTMHEMAVEPLARVEREILLAAKYSAEVRRFIDGIGEVGGYHWRSIRGQKQLSYHSYGMAIDILPKGRSRIRGIYWQWEYEAGEDWVRLPPSKRWAPPEEVVRAFEGNGFCWGGKWLMYDTMHFEYRPELIELRSRLLPWYLSLKG